MFEATALALRDIVLAFISHVGIWGCAERSIRPTDACESALKVFELNRRLSRLFKRLNMRGVSGL